MAALNCVGRVLSHWELLRGYLIKFEAASGFYHLRKPDKRLESLARRRQVLVVWEGGLDEGASLPPLQAVAE